MYAPEVQEALTNMPEQKMDTSEKNPEWRKKLGLSSDIDIHMLHRYSHLVEKLLRTKYNDLGVKLIGTLQVCHGCEQSKSKSRA